MVTALYLIYTTHTQLLTQFKNTWKAGTSIPFSITTFIDVSAIRVACTLGLALIAVHLPILALNRPTNFVADAHITVTSRVA
jgi:hypothetical protein